MARVAALTDPLAPELHHTLVVGLQLAKLDPQVLLLLLGHAVLDLAEGEGGLEHSAPEQVQTTRGLDLLGIALSGGLPLGQDRLGLVPQACLAADVELHLEATGEIAPGHGVVHHLQGILIPAQPGENLDLVENEPVIAALGVPHTLGGTVDVVESRLGLAPAFAEQGHVPQGVDVVGVQLQGLAGVVLGFCVVAQIQGAVGGVEIQLGGLALPEQLLVGGKGLLAIGVLVLEIEVCQGPLGAGGLQGAVHLDGFVQLAAALQEPGLVAQTVLVIAVLVQALLDHVQEDLPVGFAVLVHLFPHNHGHAVVQGAGVQEVIALLYLPGDDLIAAEGALGVLLFQLLKLGPDEVQGQVLGGTGLLQKVQDLPDLIEGAVAQEDLHFQDVHAQIAAQEAQSLVHGVEGVPVPAEAVQAQGLHQVGEAAAGRDLDQVGQDLEGGVIFAAGIVDIAHEGQDFGIVGGEGQGLPEDLTGPVRIAGLQQAVAPELEHLRQAAQALCGLLGAVGLHFPEDGHQLLHMDGGILVQLDAVVELAEEVVVVKGVGLALVDFLAHLQGQVRALVLQMAPGQVQGGLGIVGVGGQCGLELADEGQVPLPEPVGDLLGQDGIIAGDVHDLIEGLLGVGELAPDGLALGHALEGMDVLGVVRQDPADQRLGLVRMAVLDQQAGIVQGQGVIVGPGLGQLPEDGHGLLPLLLGQVLLGPEDPAIGVALGQAFQPLQQWLPLVGSGAADLIVELAVSIADLAVPTGLKLVIGQGGDEADAVDHAVLDELRGEGLAELAGALHPGEGGIQGPPHGPG